MNDLVTATLPLVEFEGPETSDLGVGAAQFDADAIQRNYWALRERRARERETDMLAAMSEAAYGDPEAWRQGLTAIGPFGPLQTPSIAQQEEATQRLLADVARMKARMPGEFANLPGTREELWTQAEAAARAELQEELAEAEGRIANRSDPNLAGGLASFGGSMAAAVTDIEGVAVLPFGAAAGLSLARTIAVESLLGGVAEGITIPAYQRQAEFLGTEAPDPVAQVLTGMAFGAALPIAGRAIRLGANSLTEAGRIQNRELLGLGPREDATTRGAQGVLARDDASRATAPEGVDDETHVAALDEAERALQDDTPQMVRVEDVVPDTTGAGAAADPATPATPGAPPTFDFEPGGNAARDANQVGYVFGRLLERGVEPHIAAGLVGNLMQESGKGLNTGAIGDNGNSIGMGQWNGPRRRALVRFAEARGVDWRDIDLQIEFLWRELNGSESAAWARIRGAKDAAEAARIASDTFWRPGVPHLSNRMAFARMVASQFDGGQVPKGGAPGRWRNPGDDALAAGVHTFDARDLMTDALAYQYKAGGDQFGVTDRLMAERVWDDSAAVGVIVHERLDGNRYIADGHQRFGLARRLMERGQTDIRLTGFLYREADGYSVEEVRALAALRNIRQESGTPLDAAKVMRDHPELTAQISRSRPFMAQAQGLAELAPGPFQAVVNGVIPQNWGAIVGRVIPDDDRLQGVAVAALKKADPANETQAESIVRDIRRLGLEQRAAEAQLDLFGAGFDLRDTVITERARVIDRVMKDARMDRALFSRLEREADTIEEAGNVLNRAENLSRAELAERALARVLILADQPGPIRDAIDAAARGLRAGGNIADAARAVFDALGGADRPAARRGAETGAGGGGGAAAPVEPEALPPDPDRPGVPDTRGRGVRFHGSTAPIASLSDEYRGSDRNFYGQGFYTSDAVAITVGYSKAGGATQGAVYRIREIGPVTALDMEQAVPDWFRTDLRNRLQGGLMGDLVEDALGENPANLREFYDAVRDLSPDYGFPTYEVQEIFDTFAEVIRAKGFNALDHIGGLRTKKAPHAVRIYLTPESTIRVDQIDPAAPIDGIPAAMAPSAPPAPVDAPRLTDLPEEGDARLQPGLFDDPVEDAAETARLAQLERELDLRLAEPSFDLELPTSADPDQPALSFRAEVEALREEADFADALKTLCLMKGS